MAKKYSPLSEEQITILKSNGCRAANWASIQVGEGFDSHRVINTVFKGDIRIGSLKGSVSTAEGITEDALIDGANLHNVTIGDNCVIRNIHSWLMNVDIADEVIIMNVGRIICTGATSFGNGQELAVLNEGGGRELKITEKTGAQVAYLNVLYRHDKALVARLDAMADAFAKSRTSTRASIGRRAQVTNSGKLTNVNIGEFAVIGGISSLENGTVVSSEDAPTAVENGVTAKNFIIQKGAKVADRAVLHSILIGEGTKIGTQFSSENSVFFANSEGFHSEACSIFGGPYTVTHHKSTLLIAGLFSFYNAGSGTNQSNHMYKLGPVHQGILERGCKTGSFSYLLWPSKVGAFTAVIGKHYANFDTSNFPFSYISDEKGKSVIIPGMNFFTVGTLRDGAKWPTRDRRKNKDKIDLLIFDVLSPFTVQKMIKGEAILGELSDKAEKSQEYVTYNGINIKRLLLKTCRRYYKMAIDKYFGDAVVRRAQSLKPKKLRDLFVADKNGGDGSAEWVDLCGLLCSRTRVDKLIADITDGQLDTLDKVHAALTEIHGAYRADEWNWFLNAYKTVKGRDLADESDEELKAFLEQWKDASQKLYNMVLNDASKEFEGNVKTGFGIDGGQDADFEAVRGTFDTNSFVKSLKKDIAATEATFAELTALL